MMMCIPLNGWKKVKERSRDTIFFAENPDLSNIIYFKEMANDIVNDKGYQDRQGNLEEERIRVIRVAENLIKNALSSDSQLIPIPL